VDEIVDAHLHAVRREAVCEGRIRVAERGIGPVKFGGKTFVALPKSKCRYSAFTLHDGAILYSMPPPASSRRARLPECFRDIGAVVGYVAAIMA